MEQNIRPLTREEQLEWYIPFLKEQIEAYEQELEKALEEMQLINPENKLLEKPKELKLTKWIIWGSLGFDWNERTITIQVAVMCQITKTKLNGNILKTVANKVKSLFAVNSISFA